MNALPSNIAAASPFRNFTRDEWAQLRADTPLTLTIDDLRKLQSNHDPISIDEVIAIYLPLSRLLALYVAATQGLFKATQRFLGAEKGDLKIAVEIKSFAGPSLMLALEQALGQFTLYDDVLKRIEPERTLYLAVSETIHQDLFEEPLGQLLLANGRLRLLVFTTKDEVIERWTPEPPTAR